jgi:Putative neutral zinc metallopeptidase
MRWRGERQSSNIEDRRGLSPKVAVGGGLGTLVVIIIALLFGADPRQLLEQVPNNPTSEVQSSRPVNTEEEELKQFVSVVLAKSEDVWTDVFRQNGRQYREPTLVLFTDQVRSACGMAGAAVGPFYCPGDEKVYIDLSFYEALRRRFNAPGDFAQAYVIAHEVGHHVQNLLDISDRVDAMQRRSTEAEANQLSMDCSKLETSKKRYEQRVRSATIRFNAARQATLCPTHSHTAHPSSACVGSREVTKAATCARATLSTRRICNQATSRRTNSKQPNRAATMPPPMPSANAIANLPSMKMFIGNNQG